MIDIKTPEVILAEYREADWSLPTLATDPLSASTRKCRRLVAYEQAFLDFGMLAEFQDAQR
jgi:hypothetical protein